MNKVQITLKLLSSLTNLHLRKNTTFEVYHLKIENHVNDKILQYMLTKIGDNRQ